MTHVSYRQVVAYAVLFLAGLLWTSYLFVNSPGVPVHDEVAHVLIARNAWRYPVLVLDIWGRPVNTLSYMIPSLWGLTGARIFSVVLAGLTVHLTGLTARRLNVKGWFLVPVCVWFQPWFNDLSYTAITEVPFSLLLIFAVYSAVAGRWRASVIVFGLLPLVRHEAIILTFMACAHAALRREWQTATLGIVPVAVYNLIYFAVAQRWPADIYFAPKPTTLYGSGTMVHFVSPVVQNVGLLLVALSLLAVFAVLRRRDVRFVVIWYAAYFLIHSIVYYFGLFASGGYYLFLLPIAPGMAILATLGIEAVSSGLARIGLRRVQTAAVVVCMTGVIAVGVQSRPRPLDPEGAAMQDAAAWLRQRDLADRRVVATHAWFFYFYDLPWQPAEGWAQPPPLDELMPGTLVVWDRHYSDRWGLSYEWLTVPSNGWTELASFGDDFAVIFQRILEPPRGSLCAGQF